MGNHIRNIAEQRIAHHVQDFPGRGRVCTNEKEGHICGLPEADCARDKGGCTYRKFHWSMTALQVIGIAGTISGPVAIY